MAASTQSSIFRNLTYDDDIKDQIINSGGTVVFIKDNIIIATEISESLYRELLVSPYIDKLDVLSLKRYRDEGVKYQQVENITDFQTNTTEENDFIKNTTDI